MRVSVSGEFEFSRSCSVSFQDEGYHSRTSSPVTSKTGDASRQTEASTTYCLKVGLKRHHMTALHDFAGNPFNRQ
jgi:hypothetical protein